MKKILSLLAMLLVAATAWSLPFVPTTDPYATTTKWYQIQSDGTYLYTMYGSYIQGSTTPSTDDYYLWCFVGTEETGYKIFHRETQSYLWYGISLNGSEDEVSIDYVDLESENENSFYIYCIDHYYLHGQCIYVAVDQGNVTNVYGRVNSFTAVEVTVEPLTPPITITIPYESLTALDYHVPHNSLGNIEALNYTNLIDQIRTTSWCVENKSGAWETIWLDFESDVWFIPNGYILTTGLDIAMNPNRNPKEWVLYGKEFMVVAWRPRTPPTTHLISRAPPRGIATSASRCGRSMAMKVASMFSSCPSYSFSARKWKIQTSLSCRLSRQPTHHCRRPSGIRLRLMVSIYSPIRTVSM